MKQTLPMILQWDEAFEIGSDTLAGKLRTLTIKIDRPQLSRADTQKLQEAQRNNKSSE